jgi:hypothetical protein
MKKFKLQGNDGSLGGFGGLFDLKAVKYKDPILVSGTGNLKFNTVNISKMGLAQSS